MRQGKQPTRQTTRRPRRERVCFLNPYRSLNSPEVDIFSNFWVSFLLLSRLGIANVAKGGAKGGGCDWAYKFWNLSRRVAWCVVFASG